MKNKILTTLGFSALLLIFSCNKHHKEEESPDVNKLSEVQEKSEESISTGGNVLKINNHLFSIPSPVQTAILIREQEIPFNDNLILDIDKLDTYITSEKQALNLGVLGSDLAYLSNYNDLKRSLNFLNAVEDMSEKLNIKANIDPTLIRRFNENISNVDSLNSLNAEFYKNAERYLKANFQNKASALVLVGGWVESMHFAAHNSENEFLKSRIAEQKSIVNNLGILLSEFDDPMVGKLKSEMSKLSQIYDGLVLDYTYKKSITQRNYRKLKNQSQNSEI